MDDGPVSWTYSTVMDAGLSASSGRVPRLSIPVPFVVEILDAVLVSTAQEVIDVAQQCLPVLQIDEVMKINPDAVDTVERGIVEFPVIDDRIVFVPHLGFIDRTRGIKTAP
jgi:chemotaxis protein histidine kinase CheA